MPALDDFDRFIAAADEPFAGWDFTWLTRTERMASGPLPWSYTSQLLPYLWRAQSMADLGTGGGEFLSCLRPLPPQTVATEGYPPNVAVARRRLEPLGVQVYAIGDDDLLPFATNSLDLIIDRHESYRPEEIQRALHPGGHFITQQVGGSNDRELNDWLGLPLDVPSATWSLEEAARGLESSGLTIIERQEATIPTRFYDIGAIVYYLKAIPWQIPNFTVERHLDALRRMHEHIRAHGYLEVTSQRFFLIARKPA